MIRTIIIDDEQHCIDSLLRLISYYTNTFTVLGSYKTVEEGLEATKTLSPDLVFLDIQIKDETGFDYLKKLGEIHFDIVFTTAFEKYAIKAFKFSALDYLLKPIDTNDFDEVVKKLKKKHHKSDVNSQMEVLFHNLKVKDPLKRISIATIDGYTFLEVSDIIYCKADVNYTKIYTKDGGKILASKTLKVFEELLANSNFYRIHSKSLICLSYIKKYTKGKGGYVTMIDNTSLDVSTRRKEQFLKLLITK